jgi:hypothetical protein
MQGSITSKPSNTYQKKLSFTKGSQAAAFIDHRRREMEYRKLHMRLGAKQLWARNNLERTK